MDAIGSRKAERDEIGGSGLKRRESKDSRVFSRPRFSLASGVTCVVLAVGLASQAVAHVPVASAEAKAVSVKERVESLRNTLSVDQRSGGKLGDKLKTLLAQWPNYAPFRNYWRDWRNWYG